jgi:hypothetical protein
MRTIKIRPDADVLAPAGAILLLGVVVALFGYPGSGAVCVLAASAAVLFGDWEIDIEDRP